MKWNISLGEEIKFFDPNLSYEITKYKPITETQGLDFDSAPFTEVGRIKTVTGKYCPFPIGTK